MCGIIAFSDPAVEDKETTIKSMMKMIEHRGPNLQGSGFYTNDQVALGFRRLSVIDLKGGHQPIYNEDNSILITFNGEIYNYQTLRTELIQAGHDFKTQTDTEVLLHGYEEWGMQGTLDRIRGMFAYLIWDSNKQTLFGARDFFGIKPLYYYHKDETFIVGSEIKSFLKHPHFKKELNKTALKPFLMNQYNDLDETFFKDVYRFPAGHWFELHDNNFQTHQYWDAKYNINHQRSLNKTVNEIDDTVMNSVKLHNIADVPVGSFLSEGVDSSYVTSVLRPQEVFSVNFDNGPYDEASVAKELADEEGLHFNLATVDGDEAFRDFAEMQYHLDEPDSNPSVIPLWYLCRLARKKVTVALSGEGADELFAGYVNYGMHTHNSVVKVFAGGLHKLPRNIRYTLAKGIKKLPNFPGKVHLYTRNAKPSDYYVGESLIYDLDQPTIFTSQQANNILQNDYQNDLTVNGIYQKDFAKVENAEDVKQMQYIDLHHFMINDILQKADKISMAHSLELRVPYLDKAVAELANSIPSRMLLNNHDTKFAFRKAAHRHLPEDWANRPKLGFPVPITSWLREEKYYQQVHDLFSEDWVADIFDQAKIIAILDDNYQKNIDARRQIWNIYTFLTWYKLYFIDFDETVEKYCHVQPDVQKFIANGTLV
ncbi:asparagine synthase (glutamine-hydrolyzing) [Bombilactobacillus thymidiniphilus]|uniref:asparagine synthase (glutamine-hydrolyzing) n=1 Tax=Bombilactobacillus thymidiniphilus TaxID=2923363 RepID=A0ABY4PCF1_9LACO|nr:asparagine synthase (glutamine-hydrolyzing) [Bombilactobacillus thymidiniphilus]UQS83181.1 asparagine synthase (glutamine-hydrolyzing) [Bombilactobacillus thymidiniphilus]